MSWGLPFVSSSLGGRWTPPRSPRSGTPTRSPRSRSASPRGGQLALIPTAAVPRASARSRGVTGAHYGSATGGYYGGLGLELQDTLPSHSGSWRALEDQGFAAAVPSGRQGGSTGGSGFSPSTLPAAHAGLAQTLQGMVAAEIDRARERWVLISKRLDGAELRLATSEERLLVAAAAALSTKERQTRVREKHDRKLLSEARMRVPETSASEAAVKMANKRNNKVEVAWVAWRLLAASAKKVRQLSQRLEGVARRMSSVQDVMTNKRDAVREAADSAVRLADTHPNTAAHARLYVAAWRWSCRAAAMQEHVEDVGKHALSVVWTARTCVQSWVKLIENNDTELLQQEQDAKVQGVREEQFAITEKLSTFTLRFVEKQRRLRAFTGWRIIKMSNVKKDGSVEFKKYVAEMMATSTVMRMMSRLFLSWALILRCEKLERGMTAELSMQKKTADAEISALRRAIAEGNDGRSEMLASKFAAQRRAEQLRTIVSAWCKVAHEDALTRKQREHEEEFKRKQQEEFKKATKGVSEELEALKKKEREAGDHTAELIAKQYRKTLEQKLLDACIDGWHLAIREDLAQKALEREQKKREQELEEMKRLHDRQGDKTAELMAKKYREERERDMLNKLWEFWSEGIAEKIAARKNQAENEKRQVELDRLKEAYRQREEHDEHTADLVAQQYRANIMRQITNQLFEAWSQYAGERAKEKKKQESDRAHQAEMDTLKSNYADKGEKQAEIIAEKFRANREFEHKQKVWAEWNKVFQAEANERKLKEAKEAEQRAVEQERAKAAEEKQAQMDDLKNQYRQAGDATAERMAEKFRHDREEKFMIRLVTTWRDTIEDEMAQRKLEEERARSRREQEAAEQARAADLAEAKKEHEEAMKEVEKKRQEELEEMKKKTREAGDHHAELMAEKFRQRALYEILERCYLTWFNIAHDQYRQKMIENERAAAQKAKEQELEQLRRQEREKGDANAEKMAKKFRKQKEDTMKIKILDTWKELTHEAQHEKHFQAERDAEKAAKKKELEDLQREHKKAREAAEKAQLEELDKLNQEMTSRGDKTAERIAEQYRHQREIELQELLLHSWAKRAKVEATQKAAEAELENLKAQQRKKGDETAELMAKQYRAAREVELAQRVAGAWARVAHEDAIETRRRAEREAAALKMADERLLAWTSKCLNGWNAEAHALALQRRNEEEAKRYDEEMQRLQDVYQSKQEETGEQLAQHFRRAANEKKKQKALTAWIQDFRDGHLERKYQGELERLKDGLTMDTENTDAAMEKLAMKYRDIMEAKLVKLCMECWQEISHERLMEKKLEAERQQMQRRHQAELEAEISSLRQKDREKGDETAERIADKAVYARNAALLNSVFEEWSHEAQVRAKRRMEEKYTKDVNGLKRMYAGKDDATAERMAEQFRKMRMFELGKFCIMHWAKEAVSIHKDTELKELQEQSAKDLKKIQTKAEQELNALKKDYTGKNEKTAERLAERFRKQRENEFLQFIMHTLSQLAHEKVRKLATGQRAQELEELRKKDREHGDETAQRIAEHYRRELEEKLLDLLMNEWSRSAQKFAAQQKMEQELAALKAKDRQAGDRNAELMAKQYRKSKDARLLSNVMHEWSIQAAHGAKGEAVEFGVQADVLMMPAEDDRAVQNAYMKTKVEVALKEIARLESEKAILRLELVAQRRRGDGALKRSDAVISRAARILFVRALRAIRERTFLSWMRESTLSAAGRREERAEAAAKKYAQAQKHRQFGGPMESAPAVGAQSGLRVAVDGGPFRIVDVNWQFDSAYEDPNSL